MKTAISFVIVALSVASLTIFGWVFDSRELNGWANSPSLLGSPRPAIAPALRSNIAQQAPPESNPQPVRVQDVWRLAYSQLPDFPKENNYVSKESGKVDPNNTLIGRLVRYHVFVKGRPPNYRFDWKLTLADYLGATPDFLVEDMYPGGDALRENPMEGDRTAIQGLNRTQRDALVQVLVNIFNGNSSGLAIPDPSGKSERSPSPGSPQPQPGDAKLLMP